VPEPLAFVRDGAGWIGSGDQIAGRFGAPDPFASASAWWDRMRRETAPNSSDGRRVAFGSFPFDREASTGGTLIVPAVATRVAGSLPKLGAPDAPEPVATVSQGRMTASEYVAAVARVRDAISTGRLEKAVIARDVIIRSAEGFDQAAILDRLAAAHGGAAVFAVDGLIGASPETLVTVHDGVVTARVLAGTAGPGEGEALLESQKDLLEHGFAARSVLEALAPHVRELEASATPFVLELPHLTHLATDVTGVIADGSDALDLVAALHPTAAVAGTPTAVAIELIRELEPRPRGRYSGAVGWIDESGDGEWAIALRCAQIVGEGVAHAFAGAGIVGDSVPELELAETALKLRPILEAFGAAH